MKYTGYLGIMNFKMPWFIILSENPCEREIAEDILSVLFILSTEFVDRIEMGIKILRVPLR